MSATTTEYDTRAFQEGCLVCVSIGKEPWKVTLTPADFGMEKFPENFEPGRRRMLPDGVLQKIATIEGQARRVADRFSFSFGAKRSRVKHRWIQLSKVGLVLVTLDELQQNFWAAVDELIEHYEEHKADMKAKFPEQWANLEKAYLPRESIRREYYFEVEVQNVVFPSGLTAIKKFELQQADLALLDREKAMKMTEAEMAALRVDHQAKLDRILREQQDRVRQRSEEFVDEAVRQLRSSVVTVFEQITNKIKDGKTIIKTNLDTIRTTLQEVRQLDFLGSDAEFHAKLAEVQKLVDSGREFRDDAQAVRALNAALGSTVEFINKSDAEAIRAARKTYFGRRLTLDGPATDGGEGLSKAA